MSLVTKRIVKWIFLILPVFYISCANVVAPTGGPKDEDPPVILRSNPPNYSTFYNGEDVRVFFDEFVEIRNLQQNLLVSPPLKNNPEVRVRGRSIIMSINDTLLENTTYNFFFGESIVDLTEGNAIPNFQYIVSTGSYVDSLSVRGTVVNALTLKPEENVFVMMYNNVYDSVPILERPVYLTKANAEGEFLITNIREGEYMLFALIDMNSNFLFDNPDEKIAFLDSLITPVYMGPTHLLYLEETEESAIEDVDENGDIPSEPEDETGEISLSDLASADSIPGDTLSPVNKDAFPSYELYLFQEKDTVQRFVSATMAARGKLNLVFRIPSDSVVVREYENPFDREWFIPEYSKARDTLTLWLPGMARDTLRLEISDRGHVIDSVTVSLLERTQRGRDARRASEDTEPVLTITAPTTAGRGVHPYYKEFELKSQTPLDRFDIDLFEMYLNDSIPVDVDFRFADEVRRTLQMTSMLEPDSAYRLLILPGSITDMFGVQNDTLSFGFKLNNEDSYGTIVTNITLPEAEEKQYILQLLDEKMENVIDEKIITESGAYPFRYLGVSTFAIRLVFDENKNGEWDTGHYLRRQQPEKVKVYPENVQSRLNWEVEILWDVTVE